MGLMLRISKSWISSQIGKHSGPSRASFFRALLAIAAGCLLPYLLVLLVFYIFGAIPDLTAQGRYQTHIHEPAEDAIKHFLGSRDCGITQADLYDAPWPTSAKVSPFCKSRPILLEALSGGGRHGFDEPYVGKGCTYRWFSTTEICMILERFNSVVFVGDDIARSIYTAFNIILREDIVLGGVRQWIMSDGDKIRCKCDNQFTNSECQEYAVRSIDDAKKDGAGDRNGSPYICERIPHAYLPVEKVPSSPISQAKFRDLMYLKPNPWQPSPIIFSFSHGSAFDIRTTVAALDEWRSLATAAERNIPMLFLGPTAFGMNEATGMIPHIGNSNVCQYQDEIAPIAAEKHFDVLSLYNLTLQASTADGEQFGEKVALVEAMMVINWLSMLETS